MTQGETNIWRSIILGASKAGYRLFRNQRYKGKSDKGAWLDCGVGGDGGSDLIGYRIITVTPEMVGTRIAVFCAIEAKVKGGRVSVEQTRFLDAVKNNGGIGIVAYGLDDLEGVSYNTKKDYRA